jgi:uncharacterized protein YdeI (YjbR/CyaY-like superfamily)
MKVPYAETWQPEINSLRSIALACGLKEELKWGKPCFTLQKKNVVILIPLKESCAVSFFKGALMKDPERVLQKIGEHSQAGRWIKVTSLRQVAALRGTLKRCIEEAIRIEQTGKKVPMRKVATYEVPGELAARLKAEPALQAAFDKLTPGRRKSYILHISGAKQSKTRTARAEKCVPMILAGRGFNERPG